VDSNPGSARTLPPWSRTFPLFRSLARFAATRVNYSSGTTDETIPSPSLRLVARIISSGEPGTWWRTQRCYELLGLSGAAGGAPGLIVTLSTSKREQHSDTIATPPSGILS
jgi:hypothetical protein